MSTKKLFFASHAKSSAALISLVIHAVFIVVAVTFVAVKVITKDDQNFEAVTVTRPKMQLKKLQVPATVKQRPKPKLRKRIVAKPKMNQKMPDIQMPEITGVKGGIGNSKGNGLGGMSSVGFTMPEIEIFGVKSRGKGEKIVLILNCNAGMMSDEMGGIPAYTIIKEELIRIVEDLPSTVLFNVFVFEHGLPSVLAFPDLVPASEANAEKLKEWLMPLNSVRQGMQEGDWGIKTLGQGGTHIHDKIIAGRLRDVKRVGGIEGNLQLTNWSYPVLLAQKMQADTIFVLTNNWSIQRVMSGDKTMSREDWDKTNAGKKWNSEYQKALKKLDEEQARRAAAGEPPKAIPRHEYGLRGEYYPGIEAPPEPRWYNYTPKDMAEALVEVRKEYSAAEAAVTSGLAGKKSNDRVFSLNVVEFIPEDQPQDKNDERFKQLTNLCRGEHQVVSGLKAIQNYVQ